MIYLWKALGYESEEQQTLRFQQTQQEEVEQRRKHEQEDSISTANRSYHPPLPRLVFAPTVNSQDKIKLLPDHPPSLLLQHESEIVPKLSATSLLCGQEFTKEWTLMFSTNEHGRSFPRFVSAIGKIKGPSLVIIQEEDVTVVEQQQRKEESKEEIDDASLPKKKSVPGNIFGCVTHTPWDNVKTREMNAKAASAAKSRAARTGVALKDGAIAASISSKDSTPNQAPQFFGTSECFVFKKSFEETEEEESFKIFHPRPSSSSLANGNFMYFFDVHPESHVVGIGFGGTGARRSVGSEAGMAFFIDRSLSRGEAAPGGCITFQYSEQLSRKDPLFKIKSMEVWALSPEKIERDYSFLCSTNSHVQQQEGSSENAASPNQQQRFTSPALSQEHAAAKVMLELNGGKMWSENNEREDV